MVHRTPCPFYRLGIEYIFAAICLAVATSEITPSARGQSEWQKNLFGRVSQSAAKLSRMAEAPLIARIDQPQFRAALAKCCPSISSLTAIELLKRLQAEISVSEVVSGFPSTDGSGFWWDPTIVEGYTRNFFANQWQVRVLHNGSFDGFDWAGTQDDAETKIYGLRPFSKRGKPANFSEASERGPYCAVNTLRIDSGSPLYGDVSAVFSPTRMRDINLISAVDTGSFEGMCNHSMVRLLGKSLQLRSPFGPLDHNCSAFPWGPSHLGTMEHFFHLLLINDIYWNATAFGPLLSTLARIIAKPESNLNGWGKGYELRGMDFIHYFESMPAGVLRFPQDVKFLIGKFPRLFGTVEGAALQQWCLKRGWLLVWSLGLNVGDDVNFFTAPYLNGTFPSNLRFLDPRVALSSSVNISRALLAEASTAFDKMWLETQRVRAIMNLRNSSVSSGMWKHLYLNVSSSLSPELQLEPLRAAACEDEEHCIGTNRLGHCTCYDSNERASKKKMLDTVDTTFLV